MDSLVQRRTGFLPTNFILWIFFLSIVSSYSSSESETIVERKNTRLKKTPRRTRKILRGRKIPALPCDKDNNDDDMDALEIIFASRGYDAFPGMDLENEVMATPGVINMIMPGHKSKKITNKSKKSPSKKNPKSGCTKKSGKWIDNEQMFECRPGPKAPELPSLDPPGFSTKNGVDCEIMPYADECSEHNLGERY